jgi:hypothetical protein
MPPDDPAKAAHFFASIEPFYVPRDIGVEIRNERAGTTSDTKGRGFSLPSELYPGC